MEQSVKHKVIPPLSRARVLIAEDDALIAIDLETVLAEAGAVVGPCLTVEEALIAAAESELSTAMLDIQLRNETIEPVARLLARRNTPFVFLYGAIGDGPSPPHVAGEQNHSQASYASNHRQYDCRGNGGLECIQLGSIFGAIKP
jgi:CheY-like chemotaxis protein